LHFNTAAPNPPQLLNLSPLDLFGSQRPVQHQPQELLFGGRDIPKAGSPRSHGTFGHAQNGSSPGLCKAEVL
jgi:hypothetical protein